MQSTLFGLFARATLLAFIPTACCADPALTPAQALSYVRVGDLHFSPNGSKLAYIAISYRWDWQPHIRVTDVATGRTRELTPPKKSERSPQWSPDGKLLAFLSDRGGKTQVYTMPAGGGDATALTARKFGVDSFHWSPDGQTIAYLAKDDTAPDEDSGPRVADRESELSRLWLVDPATRKTSRLGLTGIRIDDFQWQDPAHILIAATSEPRVEEYTNSIYSVATRDGALTPVLRPPQPFDGLIVSPDGKEFAVRSTRAHGPLERDLLMGKIGGNSLHDASAPPDLAVAEVKWHEEPALWMRLVHGFRNEIWRFARGAAPQPIDLPYSVASFDVSRDGSLAFAGEDFTHLPEIYLRNKDGHIRQLGNLQQGWDGIRLAPTTTFWTKSFDGTPIEAALMMPIDAPANEKLPLVLRVHGGPDSNFSEGYGWETAWSQLLAAHGYEVLMVNPRGSNGYSEDFVKANRGDLGGGDYRDLVTVLDAVIARGETDPGRLGIGGWSYGGEMSEWAITQTRRFKAAVAGAGVFDQQAEFETEDDPAADEWEFFGTPWQHPDVYARNSPATYIANAHTPTLIFDGEEDQNNPVGQSKGLYRALKHLGVETEMVLYPDEGHSPKNGSYNIDMFTRILDWYDRHLKGAK
ncbi:MAG TPA: S9 family peptidase [Rhizomicrobium sp.]|jgi:dipeptidyl aminopeptidase/acylaminoacyl peptidase|nr:S9 family peptidase [Rhizomicrobium sp.]